MYVGVVSTILGQGLAPVPSLRADLRRTYAKSEFGFGIRNLLHRSAKMDTASHSLERQFELVKMILRPARLTDIPQMAGLRAQEWETEAYWTDRITGYLQGQQSPHQAHAERAAFVAMDGTVLIGFVAGHRTSRFGCDAELQWIDVAKPHRGKGIARRLIAQIGAWFVEQGARRVCINVEPDNIVARHLYQRCGAQQLKSHWMIWEDSRAMLLASEP